MPENAVVYIVDDDSSVRDGLQMLFESAGHKVAAFADAENFLQGFDRETPCCVILDLQMPGTGGLEVQELLAQEEIPPPVIFLTGHGNVPSAVGALKKGAIDFFQKPLADAEQLLNRVGEAIRLNRDARAEATQRAKYRQLLDRLTPRETEIMGLICNGKANKVIAIELGISERTVELHRAHIMQKLGIHTVAELVMLQGNIEDF